jgi:hypothetical protein
MKKILLTALLGLSSATSATAGTVVYANSCCEIPTAQYVVTSPVVTIPVVSTPSYVVSTPRVVVSQPTVITSSPSVIYSSGTYCNQPASVTYYSY